MANETEDAFAAAFAQISAEDNKTNQPAAKPAVPSVAAADNQPVSETKELVAAQPAADGASAETHFELPEKTPEELVSDAEAAIAAAKTPEEKTAAEALKADAEAAKAAADAEAAKAAAAAVPNPNQEFFKQFAETMKSVVQPQPQPQPQQQRQEPPLLTQEEAAFLDKYDQEFPDVAKAEFLRRKVEYNHLLRYIFSEISQAIAPQSQMLQTIAERMHLGDIQSHVSDYDQVRDEVVAWVEKQPPYLKSAYTNVVTSGTTDEVVDLINRWRADTGKSLPSTASTAAAQVTEKKVKEPSPAAKAAAAALAPVSTKRTGAVQAEPTTFEDAFTKFANEMA